MSLHKEVTDSYHDKESEKSLRKKIFIGFLSVTSIISLLFIIEGYDASVEFGRQMEGQQLQENAVHLIEVLDSLNMYSPEDEEIKNVVHHLHTNNESAAVFKVNGVIIKSSKDIADTQLNNIIDTIRDTPYYDQARSAGDKQFLCDGEFCLLEQDDQQYNWVIYDSKEYGSVLIIQKHNLISAAREFVIPRMIATAVVVIWLGLWSSFGIALILSKFIYKYQKSLKDHIFRDRITGLHNEKALIDKLYHLHDIDSSEVKDCYLMLISIDNLEDFQFLHGIELREILFQKISNKIKEIACDSYTGVYGRDIFYILFINDTTGPQTLEKNLARFSKQHINVTNIKYLPAFSLGKRKFLADDYSPNEVVSSAYYALNRAKDLRVRSFTYTEEDNQLIHMKSELFHDLDTAIENQELILHYQPKINLMTKDICGLEALVRWNHPTKGLLYPDAFIDLIETSSIASQFTSHIVDLVIAQTNQWSSDGLDIKVAVNVSPYDLADDKLTRYLTSLHNNNTLLPDQLEIELTEIENTVDIKHLSKMLYLLKDIGINCAIDDFGTGMGSLTYLKDIPISTVKIDRSFVMDIDINQASAAITESTVKLASKLGCSVVAEGVENAHIERILQNMKCDIVQGYYYSRPIPGDEVFDFIVDFRVKSKDDRSAFLQSI